MAPVRLTFWLILLLFTARFSNIKANAHQDCDAAVEVDAVSKGKGVLDGEGTSTVATDQRLEGRRMGSGGQVRRLEKVEDSGVTGHTSQFAAGESVHQRNKSVAQFSEQVDEKEFVAFNADYRAPRHHPPKNN